MLVGSMYCSQYASITGSWMPELWRVEFSVNALAAEDEMKHQWRKCWGTSRCQSNTIWTIIYLYLLDIFGLFHVKRGRGSQKIYGCIFVCFVTRAAHIEDVGSLETDSFIQALRRFISSRGAAKEIWSDNGTNFIGGEKELRRAKEWNQTAITESTHVKGLEWHF